LKRRKDEGGFDPPTKTIQNKSFKDFKKTRGKGDWTEFTRRRFGDEKYQRVMPRVWKRTGVKNRIKNIKQDC